MADSAAPQPYPPPLNLRRANSIPSTSATTPPPPSPIDLSLLSSKSYTSLRDILPSATAAVNSPTASAVNSGYEISIRNRLVKQAAWAYLQPMSASSYSAAPNFFQRFCLRFSAANPIAASLRFITGSFIPAVLRFIRFCICS